MRFGSAACSLAVLLLAACGGGTGTTGSGLGSSICYSGPPARTKMWPL